MTGIGKNTKTRMELMLGILGSSLCCRLRSSSLPATGSLLNFGGNKLEERGEWLCLNMGLNMQALGLLARHAGAGRALWSDSVKECDEA